MPLRSGRDAQRNEQKEREIRELLPIFARVPDLPPERMTEAVVAAGAYPARVTSFYVERILNGRPDDPLLDVVLPSVQESQAKQETWDANQDLAHRAVDSPFWSQKYPQEGLIRLNTFCSALCRYCYVREQTARRQSAKPIDLERIFAQLADDRARELREVILSGGDPLTSPPHLLKRIGAMFEECNEKRRQRRMVEVQLTVHTREPVWRPDYYLKNDQYAEAFASLRAYAYVFQVIHAREVTNEFRELVDLIAKCGSRKPLLLNQHPLFRGINASGAVLAELYEALTCAPSPIKPYYVVHPFDSGTLPKHRLSLPESQAVIQDLFRRVPGIMMPTLVVPTPCGKAYISPYEPLIPGTRKGRWQLRTKTGDLVDYVDLALADALPVLDNAATAALACQTN